MANPFDQFDTPAQANPFDKFDQARQEKLKAIPYAAMPEMSTGDIYKDRYTLGLQRPVSGLSNAIAGSLASLFGKGDDSTFGERYTAGEGAYDQRLAEAEKKAGTLGTVVSIAGSLTAPGPKGGGLTTRLAQGTALGAAEGAARNSDDLSSAAKGALVGGGFGLVGTGAGEAIGKVTQMGMDRLGQAIQNFRASPTIRAQMDFSRAARDAGISQADINAAVARMGPEGMAIDVLGTEGGSYGRNAANLSPESRNILDEAMSGRKAGQNQRIASTIQTEAGVPPNSRQTVDDIVNVIRQQKGQAVTDAYNAAKAAGYDIPNDVANSFMTSPMFRSAYNRAGGQMMDRLAGSNDPAVLSELGRLNQVKIALESRAQAAMRSGDRELADRAGGLAGRVRDAIDAESGGPEYQTARGLAQESFQAQEAAQRGGDLAAGRVDIGAPGEAAAVVNPEHRGYQKQGYAQQQAENLLNKGSTDAAPSLLQRPLQQEAIQSVFDPAEVARINNRLGVERDFNRSARDVQGNSSTARQLIEAGAFGGLGALTGYMSGFDPSLTGILAATSKFGAPILRQKLAMQARAAAPELARLLTQPAGQMSLASPVARSLLERASPATRAALAHIITRGSIAGGT